MKKSFCDICGKELHDNVSYLERIYDHGSRSIETIITFRYPKNGAPSDLCKKCARELLDKIEL